MHSLALLARHLACAGFSLRAVRAVDAARCVAAAALAALADAVMRAPLSDAQSQVPDCRAAAHAQITAARSRPRAPESRAAGSAQRPPDPVVEAQHGGCVLGRGGGAWRVAGGGAPVWS